MLQLKKIALHVHKFGKKKVTKTFICSCIEFYLLDVYFYLTLDKI